MKPQVAGSIPSSGPQPPFWFYLEAAVACVCALPGAGWAAHKTSGADALSSRKEIR